MATLWPGFARQSAGSPASYRSIRSIFVLGTPTDLWALRYPEAHPLLMLERAGGGPTGRRHLDAASPAGTVRVRSGALSEWAAVLFASEQMDEDPGWRPLDSGELVHVDGDLHTTSHVVVEAPPAHQIHLEDLDSRAHASQRPAGGPHASAP